MPRTSARKDLVRVLNRAILGLVVRAGAVRVHGPHARELKCLVALYALEVSCRYVGERTRRNSTDVFDFFAWIDSASDNAFRREFRMTRPTFVTCVERIRHHNVFQSGWQRPVDFQFTVFFQYIGFAGNGVGQARLAASLGIGVGTVQLYVSRCVCALQKLKVLVLRWPDPYERLLISQAFTAKSGLQGCVGAIEGTLFTLAQKPSDHGEDYFSRKSTYALNGLVVCDHAKVFRYVYLGWPGSSHDQRVLTNAKLSRDASVQQRLSRGEYLVGDSAYAPKHWLVPPFKNAVDSKAQFNATLSRMRIVVEHVIGMLKTRFQILRLIPIRLASRDRAKHIVQVVEACMILHNMCIREGVLDQWCDSNEIDIEEEEDSDTNCEESHLGTLRRQQLFDLFCMVITR